jgi:hypothetical protein
MRSIFIALILAGGVLGTGCSVMMYPFALMFGGPTESTLVEVRKDFATLQACYPNARHVFMPTYLIVNGQHRWDRSMSEALLDLCVTTHDMTARGDSTIPGVPFGKMGMNQYRFLWNQADVYSEWVKGAHLEGDYIWFSEIFMTDSLGAYAIQSYVITPSGRIAYLRQLNSHWFPQGSVKTPAECAEIIMRTYLRAMKRDPEDEFPPYGVG